jgi:hypothetical protein
MSYPFKQKDAAKQQELESSIRELDRLNSTEYLELTGGSVVNSQLKGGEFKPKKGGPTWHEADTKLMMLMRHRYTRGEWRGEQDRSQQNDRTKAVPLTHKLSAEYLSDLADFVEAMNGNPNLVKALNEQATSALFSGDVSEIFGDGISAKYDVVAENAAHREGYTYFYFNKEEDGSSSLQTSAPPGVTLPEWPVNASESQETQTA